MMKVEIAYEFLLTEHYFTEEELILITNMWGLNMETLDLACKARYELDYDQIREEFAEYYD